MKLKLKSYLILKRIISSISTNQGLTNEIETPPDSSSSILWTKWSWMRNGQSFLIKTKKVSISQRQFEYRYVSLLKIKLDIKCPLYICASIFFLLIRSGGGETEIKRYLKCLFFSLKNGTTCSNLWLFIIFRSEEVIGTFTLSVTTVTRLTSSKHRTWNFAHFFVYQGAAVCALTTEPLKVFRFNTFFVRT